MRGPVAFYVLMLSAAANAAPVDLHMVAMTDTEQVQSEEPAFLPKRPGATAPAPTPQAEHDDPNKGSGLKPVTPLWDWTESTGQAVPDRWRLAADLDLMPDQVLNPYRQNTLKGDRPIRGHDEFLILNLTSDSIWEPRKVATPVGPQATGQSGENNIFGENSQNVFGTTAIFGAVYLKGDTTFRPPDYEVHFTGAYNFLHAQVAENRTLNIDPGKSRTRRSTFFGVQELFVDVHLRNISDRYDFDSYRVGIQPISLDFRGFLFQDLPLSARLFGTRDNNLWQYNLLWARRLEKDTNTGLNSINQPLRDDDIFAFNLYRQDWPVVGFTAQSIVAYNINREGQDIYYNRNGFIERPGSIGQERGRNYQVGYFGLNGDGHFNRINLSVSGYLVAGRESNGLFKPGPRQILAGFVAAEASIDWDWTRLRLSALYATGENDPYDQEANGFDAINENPLFAGADTSYWIRQSVPLIGGGGVALSSRNGMLINLRTSKEHGQSNFTNPGTVLLGVGADFDVTPTFRLSTNCNHLRVADTAVLEVARNQALIAEELGWDLSVAAIWRPFFNQNAVIRVSWAELVPGKGYKQLFGDSRAYSGLANIVFNY